MQIGFADAYVAGRPTYIDMQTVQSELTAADHRNRQANKKISRQANRIQWLLTQRKMSLLALEKNAAQVKQLQCIANRIKLKGTISLSRPLDTQRLLCVLLIATRRARFRCTRRPLPRMQRLVRTASGASGARASSRPSRLCWCWYIYVQYRKGGI